MRVRVFVFNAAQRSEARHSLSKCLSVRLSVCHTCESCLTEAVQDIKIRFTPYHRAMSLVPLGTFCDSEFKGFTPNECVKDRHPLSTARMGSIIRDISETVQDGM